MMNLNSRNVHKIPDWRLLQTENNFPRKIEPILYWTILK